ncbi:MAG: hypothetical protein PHD76_01045 [Methylacidiphilales bacterium]|nr:hypothetical protein [Candidatus Methylacidiphilales bacterium]
MKRLLLFPVLLVTLLACGGTGNAQVPPQEPPPSNNSGPGPDAGHHGPFGKNEKGPRPPFPHPFLVAGDPRFQKMLIIALVPPDQVDKKLAEWPDYKNLDAEKKAQMAQKMGEFRERIHHTALEEAEKLGLQLPDNKKEAFVQAYWNKRIVAESALRKEAEEKDKASMQRIRDELKKEFQ